MISGFSEFMFKHNIPATAAAFSIGGASAEMAKCLTHTIVIPIVYTILGIVWRTPKLKIQFRPFAESFVTWICVLVTSYILMELLFARAIIGASTIVLDHADKKKLDKARVIASQPLKDAKEAIQRLANVPGTQANAPSLYTYDTSPTAAHDATRVFAQVTDPTTPERRGMTSS